MSKLAIIREGPLKHQSCELPMLIEITHEKIIGQRDDEKYERKSWTLSAGPVIFSFMALASAVAIMFAVYLWSKPLLTKLSSFLN